MMVRTIGAAVSGTAEVRPRQDASTSCMKASTRKATLAPPVRRYILPEFARTVKKITTLTTRSFRIRDDDLAAQAACTGRAGSGTPDKGHGSEGDVHYAEGG